MGCNIVELLDKKEVDLKDLHGKIIAVDAHIFLYQFLTTIRQQDGTLLMDSKGKVTSHLTGLFARTLKLIEGGLKLVYVFDGNVPELKKKELEKRKAIKIEAQKKYEDAVKKEDIAEMKKFAVRTTRLTPEMISESKMLIKSLGVPVVEAESEGEAQAAYMVAKGDADFIASQDADTLLFGGTKLIRNLSLIGKRKIASKLAFETYKPELIDLSENLNKLGIDQNQLIALGMQVGTDFNPGGIKGIGPKNALKNVKKFGSNLDGLFDFLKWDEHCDIPWRAVFDVFDKMPVNKDYSLKWEPVDRGGVFDLLVTKHDFSEERVNKSLDKFEKGNKTRSQKGLGEFF
jgi:flap endonuclease-1